MSQDHAFRNEPSVYYRLHQFVWIQIEVQGLDLAFDVLAGIEDVHRGQSALSLILREPLPV